MNFQYWKKYFADNQSHFEDIDWDAVDQLNREERNCIHDALQQFQKGEHSEGKHLFNYAKKFGDPEYIEAIKLFIKEEQKHAIVLAKYMDIHRIPRIKEYWIDNVFRGLRKFAGLENTLIVLVTAEIIAKVFYRSLNDATNSVLLRKICRQILQDEDQHLAFQAFTLNHFYKTSPRWKQIITRSWHRILMTGTIFVVWAWYKKVFKRGGSSFSRFFRETMLVYFEVERGIKSRSLQAVSVNK